MEPWASVRNEAGLNMKKGGKSAIPIQGTMSPQMCLIQGGLQTSEVCHWCAAIGCEMGLGVQYCSCDKYASYGMSGM